MAACAHAAAQAVRMMLFRLLSAMHQSSSSSRQALALHELPPADILNSRFCYKKLVAARQPALVESHSRTHKATSNSLGAFALQVVADVEFRTPSSLSPAPPPAMKLTTPDLQCLGLSSPLPAMTPPECQAMLLAVEDAIQHVTYGRGSQPGAARVCLSDIQVLLCGKIAGRQATFHTQGVPPTVTLPTVQQTNLSALP